MRSIQPCFFFFSSAAGVVLDLHPGEVVHIANPDNVRRGGPDKFGEIIRLGRRCRLSRGLRLRFLLAVSRKRRSQRYGQKQRKRNQLTTANRI